MVKLRVGALADRMALLGGAALVVYGVSMWSPPAAVTIAGLLLMAGALWRHP